MDKYYYLIAQLPILYFDKQQNLTIESFLQEAKKWVTVKDYSILSSLQKNDLTFGNRHPSSWRYYQAFEHDLLKDLVLWRKARTAGQEYKPVSFSASVVKEGNPLQIEKKLLKFRWYYLEEIEGEHHFDLDFLVIYLLKLQILHRLSLFDKEKGLEKYHKICQVME